MMTNPVVRCLLAAVIASAMLWPLAADEAASAAPEEYDLQRCVNAALARNPSLRMAAAEIAIARADLAQARSTDDPRINASGSLMAFQDPPSFIMPGLGQVVYGQRLNADAALQVDIPLTTGGQTDAAKAMARAGIRAAMARDMRARQSVVLEAVTAYFNVLKAADMQKVAEAQRTALAAQNHAVTKMHEVGLVAKLDPLRTTAALAGAEEAVILCGNRAKLAEAALKAVLGLDPDQPIVVVERFEDIALPADLKAAVDEALTNRPEVQELRAQIDQADSARRFADNQDHPTLGVFGRADLARSSALPRTGVFSAGIGVKWPLFDGNASEAAEDRAIAQRSQLEARLDGLRDQITVEATEAFLALQSSQPRIETTEKAVAAADEGFELAAVGYANQVVPLTDMLDAQAQRAKAQNDRAAAVHDRRAAMARLVFALGR